MRLNRSGVNSSSSRRSCGSLSLEEYGRGHLPSFSWDSLDGDTVREKAWCYVLALGMEPSAERGTVMYRVECVLEDSRRAGSHEDEVLEADIDSSAEGAAR